MSQDNVKSMRELCKVLVENGLEGLPQLFEILLNEAMKIERSQAINAEPYERTEDRRGYANGFKPKTVNTRIGAMTVQIPQVRGMDFYPQSLEKGCRSEKALKLAIAEMYVQGVSTRKVRKITEQLCGLNITSSQVSTISKELDTMLQDFRNRPLSAFPYVFLDARYEKVRHGGCIRDVAVLVAIGISTTGKREVLGVSVSLSEAEVHWRSFLEDLHGRGLKGVRLFISDDHSGLKKARLAVYSSIPWQRCTVHFWRNAKAYIPKMHLIKPIKAAFDDIISANDFEESNRRVKETILRFQKEAPAFTSWLEDNIDECLTFKMFPVNHWRRIRTTNMIERVNQEIKRRTRVVRLFPNEASCERLISAVLVELHEEWLTGKIYLNTNELVSEGEIRIYRKDLA
ncbi:IS256 family transposase [bacterium]|nr:IS256 family transposase [bacterium]